MNEQWVQIITIIVSNLAIILTFFGITVSLNNRLDARVQEEIRDFRDKLLKIEADRRENGQND